MKQYKLIKEYPGSPKLGTINDFSNGITLGFHLVVNQPEFWEEIIKKDYEILNFICISAKTNNTLSTRQSNGTHNWESDCYNIEESKLLENKDYAIYSVKRLYDGEIFTIGDEILIHDNKYILNKLYIQNNELYYKRYDDFSESSDLFNKSIKHIKQLLFTTEDGVDIFEGDKYFYNNKFAVFSKIADKGNYGKIKNFYFSTKELTEEYILMNKPCLSLNDIDNAWKKLSCKRTLKMLISELKEITNTKING